MGMTVTSRAVDNLPTKGTTDLAGSSPGLIGTCLRDAMQQKAAQAMLQTDAARTTDHQTSTEAVANLETFLWTVSLRIGAIMMGRTGRRMVPEATAAAATSHPTATGKTVKWFLLGEATVIMPMTAEGIDRIVEMLAGMLTERVTGGVMGRSSVNAGESSRDLIPLTETDRGGTRMGEIGVHLGMAPASAGVLTDLQHPQRSLPRIRQTWVSRLTRLQCCILALSNS